MNSVAGEAISFAPEQTLRDAALAVYRFTNFKITPA
jgi:hypothetical protein